jgi:hypothetical protein
MALRKEQPEARLLADSRASAQQFRKFRISDIAVGVAKLDADGNFGNIVDAGWIEEVVVAAAQAQGLGTPRYIKPGGAEYAR